MSQKLFLVFCVSSVAWYLAAADVEVTHLRLTHCAPMEKVIDSATGILLQRYRFSKNSLVVIWLTASHGKVKTSVRGATKPDSPFSGSLELFSESEIFFSPPKRSDLGILLELKPSPTPPIPAKYHTQLAAAYFSELCDLLTEPMLPVPETYDLLFRAWEYLRNTQPTIKAVVHFEREIAVINGIYDPSIPPHASLSNHCGCLPKSRSPLFQHLAYQ